MDTLFDWLGQNRDLLALGGGIFDFFNNRSDSNQLERFLGGGQGSVIDPFGQSNRNLYAGRLNQLYNNPNYLENLPGYTFARDQGEKSIRRQAARTGQAFGGKTFYDLLDFNQGLAERFYESERDALGLFAGAGFPPDASTGYNTLNRAQTLDANSLGSLLAGADLGQGRNQLGVADFISGAGRIPGLFNGGFPGVGGNPLQGLSQGLANIFNAGVPFGASSTLPIGAVGAAGAGEAGAGLATSALGLELGAPGVGSATAAGGAGAASGASGGGFLAGSGGAALGAGLAALPAIYGFMSSRRERAADQAYIRPLYEAATSAPVGTYNLGGRNVEAREFRGPDSNTYYLPTRIPEGASGLSSNAQVGDPFNYSEGNLRAMYNVYDSRGRLGYFDRETGFRPFTRGNPEWEAARTREREQGLRPGALSGGVSERSLQKAGLLSSDYFGE